MSDFLTVCETAWDNIVKDGIASSEHIATTVSLIEGLGHDNLMVFNWTLASEGGLLHPLKLMYSAFFQSRPSAWMRRKIEYAKVIVDLMLGEQWPG